MTSTYLAMLFTAVSNMNSLPPKLLESVCFVESSHKINAIHKDDGGENSVGLCQLHLSTARWLGYRGNESGLYDPLVNATYAGKYLGHLLNRYHGNITKATGAYNTGTYTPKNSLYVHRVFQYRMK